MPITPPTTKKPPTERLADGFVWSDVEAIEPSHDLPQAVAEIKRTVESATLTEAPAPIDIWRPRMQNLAEHVANRMQAIWAGNVDALESLTRQEGGRGFVDPELTVSELMREFARKSKQWAKSWNLTPVAREARVRTSTFAQGFTSPIPPPSQTIRNPMNPIYSSSLLNEEHIQPAMVIHEVLIPAKPRSADGARVDDVVWVGFAYYWSEVHQRWHAIGTSVYAPTSPRSEGDARRPPLIVAPP